MSQDTVETEETEGAGRWPLYVVGWTHGKTGHHGGD